LQEREFVRARRLLELNYEWIQHPSTEDQQLLKETLDGLGRQVSADPPV
jgi:hypothetical protein